MYLNCCKELFNNVSVFCDKMDVLMFYLFRCWIWKKLNIGSVSFFNRNCLNMSVEIKEDRFVRK